MMNVEITKTEFTCKICQTKLSFDISDSKTFISKTPHDEFFGMQLTTYRVEHTIFNEKHVCVVLVDHGGAFRGFIDAYSENVTEKSRRIPSNVYPLNQGNTNAIYDHSIFDLFFIYNRDENWVLNTIYPKSVKPLELTEVLLTTLKDTQKIYVDLPKVITFNIADKQITCWMDGPVVISAIVKEEHSSSVEMINNFFNMLVQYFNRDSYNPPNQRTLLIALNTFLKDPDRPIDFKKFTRLFNGHVLYSKIKLKYLAKVDRIVERLARIFNIDMLTILTLLRGEQPVINIIESEAETDFRDVFDMFDYIERRNLLHF